MFERLRSNQEGTQSGPSSSQGVSAPPRSAESTYNPFSLLRYQSAGTALNTEPQAQISPAQSFGPARAEQGTLWPSAKESSQAFQLGMPDIYDIPVEPEGSQNLIYVPTFRFNADKSAAPPEIIEEATQMALLKATADQNLPIPSSANNPRTREPLDSLGVRAAAPKAFSHLRPILWRPADIASKAANTIPVEEQLKIDFVMLAGVTKGHLQNVGTAVAAYLEFCEDQDIQLEDIPAPCDSTLHRFMVSRAGQIQGDSIDHYVSGLKKWCALQNVPWRATDEAGQLASLRQGLDALSPPKNEPRRPCLLADQLAIEKHLDEKNSFHLCVKACLRCSRSGMLRLKESTVISNPKFSPRYHVTKKLVSFRKDSSAGVYLAMHLPWDKIKKEKGRDVVITREADYCDPVQLMALHMQKNKIRDDEFLFSYFNKKGKRRMLTRAAFIATINSCLAQESLEPLHGHSLRAGGATQLLLFGIDPLIVQIRGGWSSIEAFLRYWRELQKIILKHASLAQLAIMPKPQGLDRDLESFSMSKDLPVAIADVVKQLRSSVSPPAHLKSPFVADQQISAEAAAFSVSSVQA